MKNTSRLRLLSLAAVMVACALPATYAQGRSPNNPGNSPTSPPGNSGNTPANDNANGQPFNNDGGSAPVPEPGTWLAMSSLAAAAVVFGRRQMKKRSVVT